jgi:hypothetical protein
MPDVNQDEQPTIVVRTDEITRPYPVEIAFGYVQVSHPPREHEECTVLFVKEMPSN